MSGLKIIGKQSVIPDGYDSIDSDTSGDVVLVAGVSKKVQYINGATLISLSLGEPTNYVNGDTYIICNNSEVDQSVDENYSFGLPPLNFITLICNNGSWDTFGSIKQYDPPYPIAVNSMVVEDIDDEMDLIPSYGTAIQLKYVSSILLNVAVASAGAKDWNLIFENDSLQALTYGTMLTLVFGNTGNNDATTIKANASYNNMASDYTLTDDSEAICFILGTDRIWREISRK